MNWSGRPDNHRLPPNYLVSQQKLQNFKYMQRLPEGISTPEAKAFFNGVFELLRDNKRIAELLQILEAEHKYESFEYIFRRYEEPIGIKVMKLDDTARDSTWLGYLANGFVLVDSKSLYVSHADLQVGHFRHGSNVHRLQLHLILREMKLHPEKFGGPMAPTKVFAIYKSLGSSNSGRGLDWSQTGLDSTQVQLLFSELFETLENNASNPGFFWEYRKYWPWLLL